MDAATAQLIRRRAQNKCEYCRLPQDFSALQFHIEHIIARQHGGAGDPANLALACPECNLRKGTNLSSIDTETATAAPLFHPRKDSWNQHFSRDEEKITGKTSAGRVTEKLLQMNSGDRLRLRRMLFEMGLLD